MRGHQMKSIVRGVRAVRCVALAFVLAPSAALAGPREDCANLLQQARQTAAAHDRARTSALIDRASNVCASAFPPNSPELGFVFNTIGHAYFSLGRPADAQAAVARSLAIREKALPPDDPKIANSLNDLAFLDDNIGRYADAEALYKRAEALQEKLHGPDHPEVARVQNNLAVLYMHLGRYREAEPLLKTVTTIWAKTLGPKSVDYATSVNNLAGVYDLQGRYAEAEPLFRRALELRDKTSADVDQSLNNLARLYAEEGRYDDAEPLIRRAIDMQEKRGSADPTSLTILGAIDRERHRYDEAEATLKRALAASEKVYGPINIDFAQSLNNLAGLYADQNRYADAEPLLRRTLDIREKALGSDNRDFASDLYNLAYIDIKLGRAADAEPLLKRALAIQQATLPPDHPDIALSLNQLAGVYDDLGRGAEALDAARKAVAILVRRGEQTPNDPSDVAALERRSDRGYYAGLVHLLWEDAPDKDALAPAMIEEAFRAAQYAGGVETAKAVTSMMARAATGTDALADLVRDREDLSDRWKKLDADLLKAAAESPEKRNAPLEASLRKEQDEVDARLSADNEKLRTAFPRFAELAEARPVGVADVQDVLAPDEAFATFSLADKESFLFVVRKQDAHVFRLAITRDQVADAVKALRTPIVAYDAFSLAAAHHLYQKLFGPADALIAGAKNLIITPDGALQSLPFAVLVTAPPAADATAPDYKSAAWLIRRQAITIQPAASSLVALRRTAASKRGADPFAGFGDPVFDGSGGTRGVDAASLYRGADSIVDNLRHLPRLPETAGELRSEAKALGAPEASVHLGADASVSTVRRLDLANVRVLSFATHGLIASDLPKLGEPALVLSPPSHPTAADDGLLRASQIAQLKLAADFVILSACNTAASDGRPGAEGLSGLARAFFYAGARSILVSHWEVNSDAAVKLTTGLIHALAEDPGIGRAEALRRASLAMIDSQSERWSDGHPFFWAPFIVAGEGGAGR
jgi:CHAT domain-containing protein/Tfp pilus assembly protein PilF